jgi:integrase
MRITNNITLAKAEKIDGNHACDRGLYRSVRGGSRRWIYRYYTGGRSHEVPLDPGLSLSAARVAADGLRHARKVEKIDPRVAIKAAKPPSARTFEQDTFDYYDYMRREWDAHHATLWLQSMQRHVFPKIGGTDTASLAESDLAAVLKPIWDEKHETAIRLHGRIRNVIDHAIDVDDHNRFQHGNPADRVLKRLPRGVAVMPRPHPAPSWQDAPALYARLAAMPERAAVALRLLLLCCTPRTAEIVECRWGEIECDVLRVPAGRMKSGNARDIPLVRAAIELLASIRPVDAAPCAFVFPGRQGRRVKGKFLPFRGHMRKDGMQVLLREGMHLPWHTHGLRSTFRSWVTTHARSVIDHDAAEVALDHVVGSRVHRAYDRADLISERRDLAERWAAHLMRSP